MTTDEHEDSIAESAGVDDVFPPDDDAPHLLLIDDDRRIRDLLSRYLMENGYRVTTAENAMVAAERMRGITFDLLILDVMMPQISGFDFARDLRTNSQVPIIMLTARSETEFRIKGLEIGVDDYLPKPFEPRELLLRIANVLKRREAPPAAIAQRVVRIGVFTFDLESGNLKRGEEAVRLTERERDLLRVLAENAGQTVSRLDLAEAGITGSERAVDVQINRLRRKIEADPAKPVLIATVWGGGYSLAADVSAMP